ncbi:Cyclic nucleotide-binding domain-containing protein [Heracleum sosnowskyi]|uniref:Cyclic nucleotide-binding domain-containing protein n=1 Tax=Heracleum sosnowskyi TaxID=360622 RepID=A0AAD8HH35_9APIA|nr:Cyclic nucleotide-binding domain-containing protein [Heracleum sosnowskyi]
MEKYGKARFRRSISRMPSSISIAVNSLDSNIQKFSHSHNENTKGRAKIMCASLYQYIPGVIHPHARIVQMWNKLFVLSCLLNCFLDPLFLHLLSAEKDNKCIAINRTMAKVLIVLRSLTNFIYLIHMLLQFRLAYFVYESRAFVDQPKKIALNYLHGYFLIDFFVILPFSQVNMWLTLQKPNFSSGANDALIFSQVAMVFQYVAMYIRFVILINHEMRLGFMFQSGSARFFYNLLMSLLFSHVIGSLWYFFALQRVKRCLRNACAEISCLKYIYCGHGNENGGLKYDPASWKKWKANNNATACFGPGGFHYGVFVQAVSLATESDLSIRYMYSVFWGFQQVSTLAGNQTPAFLVWEVLFTMLITATGLVLFSLLIGNMQSFIQAFNRKSLEKSVRCMDTEQWMSHWRLSGNLRNQVRESEQYNWAATGGVNELVLLENQPENLQRDIRRHVFKFVEKFPIFSLMDDFILDAIKERLKPETYITGSRILVRGGLISKMVFIVQGKLESIGEDKNVVFLSEGDFCGEEVVTSCLEYSCLKEHGKRIRIPAQKLLSKRMVRCLTNVEAFTLRAADLEEVTSLFPGLLIRNPSVKGAIRKRYPYRHGLGVNRIKLAWRCRKQRPSVQAADN